MKKCVSLFSLILVICSCSMNKSWKTNFADVELRDNESYSQARENAILEALQNVRESQEMEINWASISEIVTMNDSIARDIFIKSVLIRNRSFLNNFRIVKEKKYVKKNKYRLKLGINYEMKERIGEIDPAFTLDLGGIEALELNDKETFMLPVTCGVDCYLYVLFLQGDSVSALFPLPGQDNFWKAKKLKSTPNFRVRQPDGDDGHTNIILIAIKDKNDFGFNGQRQTFSFKESLSEFTSRWLNIPMDRVVTRQIPVKVRKW